jgi:hypothetical protein
VSVRTWLYRIAANARRPAHPQTWIKAASGSRRHHTLRTRAGTSRLFTPGLLMLPALAIELTAAGTGYRHGLLNR